MSYYDLCCQHKGKVVQIKERCGKVHVGRIANVDPTYVWLEDINSPNGFGYGFRDYGNGGYYNYDTFHGHGGRYSYGTKPGFHHYYGHDRPGYGGGNPYFFPVALAGIGGFALGSAFFW